jgi:hypothetical protein
MVLENIILSEDRIGPLQAWSYETRAGFLSSVAYSRQQCIFQLHVKAIHNVCYLYIFLKTILPTKSSYHQILVETKSNCITEVMEKITDEEVFGILFSIEIYRKTAKALL